MSQRNAPTSLEKCIITRFSAQEIEPFDEALDRHIWSLSDQRLKWDRVIARARAEKPREVETMLQDLFDRQQEAAAQEIVHVDGDLDHQDVFSMWRFTFIQSIAAENSRSSQQTCRY